MTPPDDPELATNDHWRRIMVKARKHHDLTQDELGKRVGCSQPMINKIENGESTSSSYILRICRELHIAPPEHFAEEWQQDWSEIGSLLRHESPDEFAAARAMVKATLATIRRLKAELEEAKAQAPRDDSADRDRRK